MPTDPRKRQKKLERRSARRKEKKHGLVRDQSAGLPGQLSAASRYPILHCRIMESEGMASVTLSRQLPNGQVAAASFLVDRYCLGVKDTWAEVLHRTDYERKYLRERGPDTPPARDLGPAAARKLIEQAVEYARDLGLPPHSDYPKAMLLFGDVNAADSAAEFTFGKDGKPLFIGGPRDSLERCKQIVAHLRNRLGPDGFHYLVPVSREEVERLEVLPEGAIEEEDEGSR
jgi:hypothetical protein